MSNFKDIRGFIVESMNDETDWKPKYNAHMTKVYEQSNKEEKNKIDLMFSHLCGWTMRTILNDAKIDFDCK